MPSRLEAELTLPGSVATYDANRIVKCGFYDEYNFHKGTFKLI